MTNGNFSPSENPSQPPQPSISQEPKDTPGVDVALSRSGGRKHKTLLLILAGIFLIAGLIFTGYQLGQRSQLGLKLPPLGITPTPTSSLLPTFAPSPIPTISPTLIPNPTSTPDPTANWKSYTNEKYGFSFNYPQNWQIDDIQGPDDPGVSFSNIADGHTFTITVWRVTGFGYCYKYGEKKEIIVDGKSAETADGVGGSEICDKPEEYFNRGNTFVLITIGHADTGLPPNQIHISYDYPLGDINLAKSNLSQILSTFKFLN